MVIQKMRSLWFLLLSTSYAAYKLTAFNCANTTCEDGELRGGSFLEQECDPQKVPECVKHLEFEGRFMTMVCYEKLQDFPYEHVILYGWPSTNTDCSGDPPSKYIIRTGLCEERWKFSRSNETVTVDIYETNDHMCVGSVNSTYTYTLGTCKTNSHYQGATIKFET